VNIIHARLMLPSPQTAKLLKENRPEGSAIGQVTCPNCQVPMNRTALKSSDGGQSLSEAIYRCPECEAETKRWISP
jgi:transposase-like protein